MEQIQNAAMDRVRDEMAKPGASESVRAVGEIVTDLLGAMPGLAKKVLEGNKTLEGAFGAMRQVAQRKKDKNMYAMPPGEAMRIILEYYGIEGGTVAIPTWTAQASAHAEAEQKVVETEQKVVKTEQKVDKTEQNAEKPEPVEEKAMDALDALLEGL